MERGVDGTDGGGPEVTVPAGGYRTVAVVVREPITFGLRDPFLSSVVTSVTTRLLAAGLQPVMLMAPDDDAHAALVERVCAGPAVGVVLLSVHAGDPVPRALAASGLPLVSGGRPADPDDSGAWVDVDNAAGAATATRHLLQGGRTRIAVLTGPPDMTASADRLDGVCTALRERDILPVAVVDGHFTRAGGDDAARRVLRDHPDVDALVCFNDAMAVGAMDALAGAGRAVPSDVAVVGFDDVVELATRAVPGLTTVRQPLAEYGDALVDLLLGQLEGRPVPHCHVLPAELVVRGSA